MAQSRTGEALGASYRLVELIGSGAVGEVWRATVAPHDEAVAAKLLRPEHAADPEIVERFVRERSVLLSLRHPGVVQVRDLVVEGDRLAIVMDLVPGGSVRDVVAATGPLAPADALAVAAEVLDALAAAHARDVAHRDVKPDNVLLAEAWRPGLRGAVRVGDFGIASVVGEGRGTTTGLLGTPQYMSPELISTGRSGPAGDVYATGVMLYELLAGRTPFAGPGTDFTIAYRHVTSTPPPLDLPDDLDAALASLLAKDPAARPAAADAASRLRRLAERHAELAALPRVDAPEAFAEVERPATIVRGSTTTRGPAGPIPADPDVADPETAGHDDGPGVPEARPDLGTDGAHTVVRPLRRPEGGAVGAAPRRAAPPAGAAASSSWRPAWLTNRVAVVGGTVVALVAAVVVAAVVLVPRGPAEPAVAGGAVAATASQRDAALPTGLTVTRDASYDPERGSVDLTLTYSAQAAPLSGAVLEVVPGLDEGDPCPAVTWTAPASVERDRPSLSGVTADCGWAVDLDVPAGDELVVEGTVPVSPADGAALDAWLDAAGQATAEAVEDPAVTGTSYVVQRLRGVEVRTPSRTVSQTTLPVTLVPVWPSGPDELNPLYSSPSTGAPSSMLDDVAGGEGGVRFADGCSGALAVSSDGLVVTALSIAPECVVRATVGAFTNLESSPFSITTRD
ncbi:serine/threonine-protein kinase [Frigoribacterium sp. PhB160]|uniref:protein kinase domain-containing protein n=1 Tax=Frigoribacterium sp. PhB160 TaxID=2485192 RepID=UPI000F485DFA|nr:serine/threonine-protein kinase [Frigoribacterium sp. PhB160]ROS59150.1 serine/threonine-protein kinase [Frigoribacterium sp. PhB160]